MFRQHMSAGHVGVSLLQQAAQPAGPVRPAGISDDLWGLAVDDDGSVRAGVAKNRGCPPQLLEYLSGDKADAVRIAVAGNKLTPPDTLEMLAQDVAAIRGPVAKNTSTPAYVLQVLAGDSMPGVRAAAAANQGMPGAADKTKIAKPDRAGAAGGAAPPLFSSKSPVRYQPPQIAQAIVSWFSRFFSELGSLLTGGR